MSRARQASAKIRSPPHAAPQIARSPGPAPACVNVSTIASFAIDSLSAGNRGCFRPGASIMWPLKSKTVRGIARESSFDIAGTLQVFAPGHSDDIFLCWLPRPSSAPRAAAPDPVEAANGSRECAPDDRLRAVSKDGLQHRFVIPGTSMVRARGKLTSRSIFMHAFLVLVTFVIGFTLPVHAADDVAAGQSVIRSQVEALGRDDAAAAYSYAAPAIQDVFPQADIFMDMVRQSYAPVYRHKR